MTLGVRWPVVGVVLVGALSLSCIATVSFDEYSVEPVSRPSPLPEVRVYTVRGVVEGLDVDAKVGIDLGGAFLSAENGPFAFEPFLGDGTPWSLRLTTYQLGTGDIAAVCEAVPQMGVIAHSDASVTIRCHPIPVNGCSSFVDRTSTDSDRTIRGPLGDAPAPYDPACMRVRFGQTVTWSANFEAFPIVINGGEKMADAGNSVSLRFERFTGKFGFRSVAKASPGVELAGAIEVVR